MKKENVVTAAGRKYAEAYDTHYARKDLCAALKSYKEVVDSYPDSTEAAHSRSQILNIVRDVVPKDVLFEAQLNLALDYAKRNNGSNARLVEQPAPAPAE